MESGISDKDGEVNMSNVGVEKLLEWLQTARIDIKNQGEGNDVKVKVLEGNRCDISDAPGETEIGAGYSLATKDKHLLLELTCEGAGELIICLMGLFRAVPSGERLPLWVDYTRLAVNKEVIFWEMKPQRYDSAYVYKKQVADGEKVAVEISWSAHVYRGDELGRLLSLYSADGIGFDVNNVSEEKGNNGRGILLFSNRKYLFALGTFLINLQKYVAYDGVIVYHDDFTVEEQTAIMKIEPRVRFIKYGISEFTKEYGFDEEELKQIFFINRYTVLAVIKFKIFQHLKDFSTMMLFDLDMVIVDGLDELLEKNFDIAWRNDGQSIRNKLNNWNFNDDSIKELGMYDIYDKTLTPNGGFFVVKRNFDYKKAYEECVNYLKNYSFIHPYSIDEIMFGFISKKMNLNVHHVDAGIYNVFPIHISLRSKLIHFLGDYKPWNKQTVQSVFREWRINYDKYVAMTGMPSQEVRDFSNTSDCILKAYYFEKWNDLFSNYRFVYPHELDFEPELCSEKLRFFYHGFMSYNIETNWLMPGCFCTVWIDKNNKNISINGKKRKLQALVESNKDFLEYWEDENGLGVRTREKLLQDIPEAFNDLYNSTAELRITHVTNFTQITTYHGTKIYLDLEKHRLVHAPESSGAELYASINGGKVALFISLNGMNLYVKEIDSDGQVSMTSRQTLFSCWHNSDHSISMEVKNGSMLSAVSDGNVALRHWNREWEHFFVPTIVNISE